MTFYFGASLALGSALELFFSPTTELIVTRGCMESTFCCTSQSQSTNGLLLLCRIREDDTSKRYFWFAVSSWSTHLLSFFSFPVCFKCWMTIEWLMLGSLAPSVAVRGSAWWWLSAGRCQLLTAATALFIFEALVSFAKLLEAPLHILFTSNFWAKCAVDVASCLCCLVIHFELELKNHWNLLFV